MLRKRAEIRYSIIERLTSREQLFEKDVVDVWNNYHRWIRIKWRK